MKLITEHAGEDGTDSSDILDKLKADLINSLFSIQKLPVCRLKSILKGHTVPRLRDILKMYREIEGVIK